MLKRLCRIGEGLIKTFSVDISNPFKTVNCGRKGGLMLSAQASVLKRDVVSTRDFDKSFADEINRLVEKSLVKCMDCGTCSSGCPSGRRTAMRIRQLVRLARLGYKPMLSMVDLWMCTTCYRCFDRCPRKVNITDAIIFIRNKTGYNS